MTDKEKKVEASAADLIDIWKKAVDTQMHFNEMSVKSRQLGLTFVAAALGLSVVLFSQQKDYSFEIPVGGLRLQVHVALLLIAASALALSAVKQLDLKVYHRMLRGAVTFGEDFEEQYMKRIFGLEKGMTQAISHYSRHDNASVVPELGTKRMLYAHGDSISAETKIAAFYRYSQLFVWTAVVVMFAVTNIHHWATAPGGGTPPAPVTCTEATLCVRGK